MAAEKEDWINWDNSMKSHIDQVEVKWKNDTIVALEQQLIINKKQNEFNDLVRVAIEEHHAEHRRTKTLIGITFCLFIIDLCVGLIAFQYAI
jgi:hypothetical protein